MLEYAHVASCNQELSNRVFKIMQEGRICLTLGGDHSIGCYITNCNKLFQKKP